MKNLILRESTNKLIKEYSTSTGLSVERHICIAKIYLDLRLHNRNPKQSDVARLMEKLGKNNLIALKQEVSRAIAFVKIICGDRLPTHPYHVEDSISPEGNKFIRYIEKKFLPLDATVVELKKLPIGLRSYLMQFEESAKANGYDLQTPYIGNSLANKIGFLQRQKN